MWIRLGFECAQGKRHLGVLIVKDDVYYRIRHLLDYKRPSIDFEADDQNQEGY